MPPIAQRKSREIHSYIPVLFGNAETRPYRLDGRIPNADDRRMTILDEALEACT